MASSEQLSCKSQLVTTCHTRVHLRRRHVPVSLTAERTQISSQQTLIGLKADKDGLQNRGYRKPNETHNVGRRQFISPWNTLTTRIRVRFGKLTILQHINKFPQFMRTKGSSPRSQHPTTLHYYEPHQSRSRLPNDFFKNNFNTILPPTSRSSRLSLSLKFPHQNPVRSSPVPHTCHIPAISLLFI